VKQINVIPRHNAYSLSKDNNLERLSAHQQQQIFEQTQQEASITLETKYQTDAAIVQYSLNLMPSKTPMDMLVRLKEKSLLEIDSSEAAVFMNWVILDWDLPSKGIRWGDPNKAETKDQLKAYMASHSLFKFAYCYYFSKSGLRVVFHLADPLKISDSDDCLVWQEFYKEFVGRFDISEIGGELELRTNPFVLNRVPNYIEDGKVVEGEVIYLSDKSIRLPYPPKDMVLESHLNASSQRVTKKEYLPLDPEKVRTALWKDPLILGLHEGNSLCYNDWRALGINIAALFGSEKGLNVFSTMSSWDKGGSYNLSEIFKIWPSILDSLENYGPIRWSKWTLEMSQVYGEDGFNPSSSLAARIRRAVEDMGRGIKNPIADNTQAVVASLQTKTAMRGGQAITTPVKSLTNLHTILTTDNRWKDQIRRNHLGQIDVIGNEPLIDEHITAMRETIARVYTLTYSKDEMWDFVKMIARQDEYNPVADYLRSLKWDGVDRVSGLAKSLGHSDAFSHTVLRKFIVSAVVRPLEWDNYSPQVNWKIDTVLILKGGQGKRKSSFFKALCSDEEWFSDNLPSITHYSKDASMHMLGKWLVEQAEFEGHVARSSVEMMKAFITREREIFRKPYGRSEVNMRRPSVLVGTTNSSSFLNDPTGDRRFWVLEIPEEHTIDLTWVRNNRDQIWSQAMHMYMQGEIWWLTDVETTTSNSRNSKFRRPDALHEAVLEFLNSQPTVANLAKDSRYEDEVGFTLKQLVTIGLDKKLADMKSYETVSIQSFLEKMGYLKVRVRVNGNRMYVYRKVSGFEEPEFD
jgi:predicted P-loop ATPase